MCSGGALAASAARAARCVEHPRRPTSPLSHTHTPTPKNHTHTHTQPPQKKGFHEYAEFVAADVGTVDSGLNSMVLANDNEMVLLPINEPTFGTRRKSQIQTYLEVRAFGGGWVGV